MSIFKVDSFLVSTRALLYTFIKDIFCSNSFDIKRENYKVSLKLLNYVKTKIKDKNSVRLFPSKSLGNSKFWLLNTSQTNISATIFF